MQARKKNNPEIDFYGSVKWFAETLLQGLEEYRTRITGGAAFPLVDSFITFGGNKPILERFTRIVETAKCLLNQPARYGGKKELPLAQGCSEEDAVISGIDFAWWATMEALPLPRIYRDAFDPPLVDWHYWMLRDAWTIDEAVNLICDIEPGNVVPPRYLYDLTPEDCKEPADGEGEVLYTLPYDELPVIEPEGAPSLRASILAAVATGKLPCTEGLITPGNVVNWCRSKGIDFPVATASTKEGFRPRTATEPKNKPGRKVDKDRQNRDRRIHDARYQSGTPIGELAKAYNCTAGEIKAALDRARKRKERQQE